MAAMAATNQVWLGSLPHGISEADALEELHAYNVKPFKLLVRHRQPWQDAVLVLCDMMFRVCSLRLRLISAIPHVTCALLCRLISAIRTCVIIAVARTPSRWPTSRLPSWPRVACRRRSSGATGAAPRSGPVCRCTHIFVVVDVHSCRAIAIVLAATMLVCDVARPANPRPAPAGCSSGSQPPLPAPKVVLPPTKLAPTPPPCPPPARLLKQSQVGLKCIMIYVSTQ